MNPLPTVIIDTREQTPFSFPADVTVRSGTLYSGDYALAGLEDHVAIERKSLQDFVGCCGAERERFKHELRRLAGFNCCAVLVEATLADIEARRYRGQLTPSQVIGSLASWSTRYRIPFLLCGDHAAAGTMCLAILRTYHRQMLELAAAVIPAQPAACRQASRRDPFHVCTCGLAAAGADRTVATVATEAQAPECSGDTGTAAAPGLPPELATSATG